MNVLVTGGAGFIGGHLCARLLAEGHRVWSVDNLDPFYDVRIKRNTLSGLSTSEAFTALEADICEGGALRLALASAGATSGSVDAVVHLAALAGVRPSIADPVRYSRVNVQGTAVMLDLARELGAPFVFGSSSSVYGNAAPVPFREDDPVGEPISPYAATKRAGELLCHAHRHLHGLAAVCLRFFTVYGPRQRPDLAIHKFARLISAGRPIPFFGDGSTRRDYTYVDDIVQGVVGAIDYATTHPAAFEIVNLGGSETTTLARLVELLSSALGRDAVIDRLPAQPGDVERTFADVGRARALFGYRPATGVEEGIPRFVDWFRREGGLPASGA
jgi:UDP-glucuronate 4-epimerase